jgi:tRNA(Ile)-lysidine synthase TilS/MesJ
MMNLFFQGRYGTMPVILKLDKMPFSIIRPLCFEDEADIRQYAEQEGYVGQKKTCPYEDTSHRADMKRLLSEIEKINPEARYSIWNALEREGKLTEE